MQVQTETGKVRPGSGENQIISPAVFLTNDQIDEGDNLVDEVCSGDLVLEYPEAEGDGGDGQEGAEEEGYTNRQKVMVVHF